MGTSTIHLRSIKSSLPSLYPLRHSRDKIYQALYRFSILQVTKSWAGPGNEASCSWHQRKFSSLRYVLYIVSSSEKGHAEGITNLSRQSRWRYIVCLPFTKSNIPQCTSTTWSCHVVITCYMYVYTLSIAMPCMYSWLCYCICRVHQNTDSNGVHSCCWEWGKIPHTHCVFLLQNVGEPPSEHWTSV